MSVKFKTLVLLDLEDPFVHGDHISNGTPRDLRRKDVDVRRVHVAHLPAIPTKSFQGSSHLVFLLVDGFQVRFANLAPVQ